MTFDKLKEKCLKKTTELKIDAEFYQSNIEGEIVTRIQEARKIFDGMIINAAGFTHTSVAIRDALNIFKNNIVIIVGSTLRYSAISLGKKRRSIPIIPQNSALEVIKSFLFILRL